MKLTSIALAVLPLVFACTSVFSQNSQRVEKSYLGAFRGESCTATLEWVGGGGGTDVKGKLVMKSGFVIRVSGGQSRSGLLEVWIENDPLNHQLKLTDVRGKSAWLGDFLSLTEIGASKVLESVPKVPTGNPPSPGLPGSPSPTLPEPGTMPPPSKGSGLPPLPTLPKPGAMPPPSKGSGLPPLPTLPKPGTMASPSKGSGLPPLPALPKPGATTSPSTKPGLSTLPPLPTMPKPGAPSPGTSGTGLPPLPSPGNPSTPPPGGMKPRGGAGAAQHKTLHLNPIVWPVGKWPEGMAHDGNFLWVAESGQRTLAHINESSGAIAVRVNAGRLPVGMATNFQTGDVFAAVATDKTVIKYSRGEEGGKFVSLPDYPEQIAADDTAIWVLLLINGSNEQGQVIRYDQNTKSSTKSDRIGFGVSDMVKKLNWLWVNQTVDDSTHINLLNPTSLKHEQTISVNGFFPSLAVSENSLFLAGGEWEGNGSVARIDPLRMQEVARRELPGEFIYQVAANNEFVVAAGVKGTLWVMAAGDLSLVRTIHLNWREFQPASLLIDGEILYITTHSGDGENGSILVVKGWAPELGHP